MTMAGDDVKNQYVNETMEHHLQKRKLAIQSHLFQKRLHPTYKMDPIHLNREHQEEHEVIQEEAEPQGYLILTKHSRKGKRKTKKKCWFCRSPDHRKRNCPHINCFYCHKPGHMKRDCWRRKVDIILRKSLEETKKKERRKRRKRNKEKEHKRTTSIYKQRLKESEFVKKQDKHLLKCKDLEIGVYLMPTTPPNLQLLRQKPIPRKKVDVLVKKETQIMKTHLLDEFLNSCACGVWLTKKEFISHINEKHGGTVPPLSQLNEPAWTHGVLFDSDEIETLYCQTSEDLT